MKDPLTMTTSRHLVEVRADWGGDKPKYIGGRMDEFEDVFTYLSVIALFSKNI